jgi:hypothetical protein
MSQAEEPSPIGSILYGGPKTVIALPSEPP